MPDLIAQGPQPEHRWRRRLLPGARHTIGRQPGDWSTPWDDSVSRQHVEVAYQDGQLHVERFEAARNPVFFRGCNVDRFSMRPGEHFVIGETTFSLVDQRAHVSLDLPRPAGERTFAPQDLRRRPFHKADQRINALSRLPEVISGAASDQELGARLVSLLLSGIERAAAAAMVAVKPGEGAVEVLHWDRRIVAEAEFRPSERLIRQAVISGEGVAHVWADAQPRGAGQFTLEEGIDWAVCVPVGGEACRGWALYVTGSFDGSASPSAQFDAEWLRDDVKFTELAATTLGGLRQSRVLAARQASLGQFFSPVVTQAIGSQDPDQVLAPREANVTVMFCDLRGFTRESERLAGDLFGLLERVSRALGVMTHHILEQGGVIGDFHGDAAMGFWGWPLPQPDDIERACRAALGIRASFVGPSRREGAKGPTSEPLPAPDGGGHPFRVGIGIASGPAVAGKIGTTDQVKVTAFGPVVNLASRLETMTRRLGASILLDRATAAAIRPSLPSDVCRVRRIARVLPVGLTAPIEVSELLPPERECPELTDTHLDAYEAALDAFEAGDWTLATRRLNAAATTDWAGKFLNRFIALQSGAPPANWDGVISQHEK